jgi:hypothetical protein
MDKENRAPLNREVTVSQPTTEQKAGDGTLNSNIPPARFHALMRVHLDSTIAATNLENVDPVCLEKSRLGVPGAVSRTKDVVSRRVASFVEERRLLEERDEVTKIKVTATSKKKKGRGGAKRGAADKTKTSSKKL